jgi:ABC-type antimicrobial peptide transport system permease subunit
VGILRAVGFGIRFINHFIFGRAILTGLLSFAIGVAAALLYTNYRSGKEPVYVLGVLLDIKVEVFITAQALFLVLVFSWLGARLASRQLQGQNVSSILRRAA